MRWLRIVSCCVHIWRQFFWEQKGEKKNCARVLATITAGSNLDVMVKVSTFSRFLAFSVISLLLRVNPPLGPVHRIIHHV